MEAFAVASSTVQLADIALRLFQTLCDFVNNAKTADTAAKELRDKVESLWTTIKTIKSVINLRNESLSRRPLNDEEKRVRRTLSKDIAVCTRVLEQFESSLEGLLRDPSHPSWLGKTLLQLQLDKRDAAIRRFENFIDTRLQMMQVSLACLEISKSQGNIEVFKQARETVRSQASDQRSQHPNDSAIGLDELAKVENIIAEDEETIEKDFRRVIGQAVDVHRASSVRAFSDKHSDATMSESARDELARADPFVSAQYNRPRNPSSIMSPSSLSLAPEDPIRADPTPDFDDTTHLEPLEALIERLTQQAAEDMQKGWYNQAERHQREAIALLQERHNGHGKPFVDFEDYQTTLADILENQQQHDQAQEIRHALLRGDTEYVPVSPVKHKSFTERYSDPAKALKAAIQYQGLSRGNHDRYQYNKEHGLDNEHLLEVAERDAKRAFKLRRHFASASDPKFLDTVDLLLKIYDAQEKTLYREVYWKLYIGAQPAPSTHRAVSSPSLSSVSPRSSMSRVESVSGGAPLRPSMTLSSDSPDLAPWTTRSDSAQGDPLYGTYSCVAGATDDSKIHLDPKAAQRDLRMAIRRDDVRTVSSLLERSGQPEDLVRLALHEATRFAKHQIVHVLLKEKDVKPDLMSQSKECALHIAAQYGHLNIIQLLLDSRANPNLAGADGWTAIHFAIHGNHDRVLFTLLNNPRRANVDARNTYGDTGLHAAAEKGEFRLADILIRAGATLSLQNSAGLSPLEVAIVKRNEKFVRSWLAGGHPSEIEWARSSDRWRALVAERGEVSVDCFQESREYGPLSNCQRLH
ncbi:hypothetical protein KVT40_000862 [Elsinoe batatas]|uniref:Ankyrin repeat protein n=1 Tax=Elsinoe batatas TaxID=2601811 RepID=A0A8K0LA37_9PEZI|nr:hypothetical protein KVT40_000862 [Elsinoe batatas]